MTESTCGTNVNKSRHFDRGTFHPFEMAFCGYSGSGKTTLIKNIVSKLFDNKKIAYIKHDAHHFSMDHQGKDTEVVKAAGAQQIYINNADTEALISSNPKNKYFQSQYFQDCEWAFIEGYKNSKIPKILLVDKENKILDDFKNNQLSNVTAIVGQDESISNINELPYFQRDKIDEIISFIKKGFEEKVSQVPLNGLVLIGGNSSRMGQDKSQLDYHGKPQYEFVFDLLDKHCAETFISVAQENRSIAKPQLTDDFKNFGPMGGILTAMKYNPSAAWLVLACDMPFLTEKTIQFLIDHRDPYKAATAYKSLDNDFPEPLCSIFEPRSISFLYHFLSMGYQCPRKVLINSPINLLLQEESGALDNINTVDEYQQARQKLSQGIN
ncbi:MAG: bifunctional molybdenum cofactor guanylyltransferase MobA/molybdopterin-guanine dinucleotide biosynthesis adaptor protein MobB [Planctomycetota bacterium]|nr:MAG: bifunctional molybdenum cofactor guanylyltransferase MobA/molybdopterin-guanine dinucleotide biosynthesis adaptor protein MobB [Planctomycetota bacterium]